MEIAEGGKRYGGKKRTEQRGMRMQRRRGSSENLGRTGIGGKPICERRPEGGRAGPWRGLEKSIPSDVGMPGCPRTGTGAGEAAAG